MGNFKQHLIWALACLAIVDTFVIAYLLGDHYYTLFVMSIMFLFGSILPDVDLHHQRWHTTLFMTIVIPLIGYLVIRKASHWGRIHSIGFGFILSLLVAFELSFVIIASVYIPLVSALFFGFLFHLITDQIYHEAQLKKDFRVALKLWSNGWKYDPLVFIFKRI